MIVSKWGNSLAVRLPRAVVEALQLQDGDAVEIGIVGSHSFEIGKAATRRQLLERLREYRGRLPADFTYDRLEANARE